MSVVRSDGVEAVKKGPSRARGGRSSPPTHTDPPLTAVPGSVVPCAAQGTPITGVHLIGGATTKGTGEIWASQEGVAVTTPRRRCSGNAVPGRLPASWSQHRGESSRIPIAAVLPADPWGRDPSSGSRPAAGGDRLPAPPNRPFSAVCPIAAPLPRPPVIRPGGCVGPATLGTPTGQ